VRTAIIWTTFWLAAGVAFGFLIAAGWGSRYAGEYWSGFLLEYSLSMDNVFVFIVLFGFFATPAAARLRVLTVGILLALALRLVAILVGGVLITRASWVLYLFGAFLLWTAWRLISHAGDPADPEHSKVLKFLKRHLPLTGTYEGARYTVSKGGKRMITTLGLVLIMLAGTDLVFALDSIPAAFGVTKEPFIVFAVNAFALMGLRSLYFVLEGMVERFEYLSYGLAVVLAFVGVKMLVKDVWHPAAWMSLAFIAVVLASSIAISLWSTRPGRNLPSG
jgi:tellurite resistance protein TerC